MKTLEDLDCFNKRIFLRVDFNVPVSNGKILDDTRINKILPTIKYLQSKKAKIILASHFGRPKGVYDLKYSLEFLKEVLQEKLKQEILFCADYNQAQAITKNLQQGQILLLENLRFHPGETKNDLNFAQQLANLADIYINDAFSCSHRAHASIVKIAELLPSGAGLLLREELHKLSTYLLQAQSPIMAIIGGSKVSTKLDLLKQLVNKVDYLAIGGAMANTFLKAQNHQIGNSFYEEDLLDTAKSILESTSKCQIILPKDVAMAETMHDTNIDGIFDVENIPMNKMALDIGPKSVSQIINLLQKCKTVILNGPVGVFENPAFSKSTIDIAKEIAALTIDKKIISIAGGGDIVAALSQANLSDKITYISTAGGAFLEWLEGKQLPGLVVLQNHK